MFCFVFVAAISNTFPCWWNLYPFLTLRFMTGAHRGLTLELKLLVLATDHMVLELCLKNDTKLI
jgi:hypothetical protein